MELDDDNSPRHANKVPGHQGHVPLQGGQNWTLVMLARFSKIGGIGGEERRRVTVVVEDGVRHECASHVSVRGGLLRTWKVETLGGDVDGDNGEVHLLARLARRSRSSFLRTRSENPSSTW